MLSKRQIGLFMSILLGALLLFMATVYVLKPKPPTVEKLSVSNSIENPMGSLSSSLGSSVQNTDGLVPWNYEMVERK